MTEYTDQSTIQIVHLESIQLNIPTLQFELLETEEEFLHQIEGEFIYCDLIVDGKLFITEKQLDEIFSIENISIHKIHESIIYINSFSPSARDKFNSLNKVVKVFAIDNLDFDKDEDEDEDDEEIFYFQLL